MLGEKKVRERKVELSDWGLEASFSDDTVYLCILYLQLVFGRRLIYWKD